MSHSDLRAAIAANKAMEKPIELAPIVRRFEGGATFQGSGNSHFTIVNGEYHVTTEVPGMKQGVPIKIRDDVEK